MPVAKKKPGQERCGHRCLCQNEAVMEILEGAISCETDHIEASASCGYYADAIQACRNLIEIIEAIAAHHKRGGKR
jgi:hypothetical protein